MPASLFRLRWVPGLPQRFKSERRRTTVTARPVPAESASARPVAMHLVVFGLLVWVQRLVKGCISLGASCSCLRHQVADGVRRLVNAGAVILLGCGLQVLVCRPHLIVQRLHVCRSIGEDGCGLLLLF